MISKEIEELLKKIGKIDENIIIDGAFINTGGDIEDVDSIQWIETDFFDIRFIDNKFVIYNNKSFLIENSENARKIKDIVDNYNKKIVRNDKK